MAEYIDRDKVLSYSKSYNADGWDSYTPLVVDVEDIEEIPAAEVIEREKIDKAIEQISKLSGQPCMVSDGIVEEVLDILDDI